MRPTKKLYGLRLRLSFCLYAFRFAFTPFVLPLRLTLFALRLSFCLYAFRFAFTPYSFRFTLSAFRF
jgi:hypothetical protein